MNSNDPQPDRTASSARDRAATPRIPRASRAPAAPTGESWETRLDRELKALPDRAAPRTLIPRVLAAIEARACLPWYRRPWWEWPLPFQVLSLLGLSALLGLATWLLIHAGDIGLTVSVPGEVQSLLAPVAPVWSALSALAGAVASVLRGLGGWVVLAGGGFCAVMYLSCIGLGTACYRLAFNRRNQ